MLLRIAIALALDPAPQETYYWNYSQHPALSYFDHPPMTAYLIYLFTGIFGDNAFGIHFSAIFISLILALLLFYFTKSLFDDKTAFWTAAVGVSVFIFSLGGIIITPDAPLLLFWLLTMITLYRATETAGISWWILSGIFGGAAFISKYPAVFLLISSLIYILIDKTRRSFLLKPGPYIALVCSIIVSLPVLIWNYQHQWASFGFQSGRRAAEAVTFRFDYLFGFIGSQIGVTGIFLMPLFIWGLVKAVGYLKSDSGLALFFWFAAPILIFFTLVSPIHYVKMNWLAPAYLSALPALVYLYFKTSPGWIRAFGRFAFWFSAIGTIAIHILIFTPLFAIGGADPIHGWQELAQKIDKMRSEFARHGEYFICGYEYKTASQLRFHLDGQPETLSNNIVGGRGLAYDFWSDPDTLAGKNCLFIYDKRNRYAKADKLTDFFEQVDNPEIFTVARGDKKITDFYIYKCYSYRGVQ
jgi:4-amino-4-deoxy-L-arabinose transferase-like glycosyltransferase